MNLLSTIHAKANDHFEEIRGIRRHLHTHPELSYQEHETSAFVAEKLRSWGIEVQTGVADTGLVALIKGQNPDSEVKALRADMDALPIQEENEVEYKSQNPGVMHACGHDVHTSSLLGAAKILHETREHWQGTRKLIFQPGEEKLPGGASLMIKDGVLENPAPQSIIGQHVYPDLPVGKIGIKSGMYMASADEIYIILTGKGGHAAIPHKNIDTVLMASHLIVALQQVVSRNTRPEVPCVLSFGKVNAPGATNVIPTNVFIEGTFRTFDENWRMEAHDRIRQICKSVAESMGGSVDCDIRVGYPFLVNDPEVTAKAHAKATAYVGSENVEDLGLRMTAEDFAYYSQQIPGCFYRLGTSSTDGSNQYGLHHPKFNVDEESLKIGMGLMAWMGV